MEPSSGLAVLYPDSGSSPAITVSLKERWLGLWVGPTLPALVLHWKREFGPGRDFQPILSEQL